MAAVSMRRRVVLWSLLSTAVAATALAVTHFAGPVDSVNGFTVGGMSCIDGTAHLVGTCAGGAGPTGPTGANGPTGVQGPAAVRLVDLGVHDVTEVTSGPI